MATIDFNIGLYGNQAAFAYTPHHFAGLRGGIGSGKSMGGSARALMAAGGIIGGKAIQTPNVGVVTAPTYRMLKDATLRTFREMAGKAVVKFSNTDMVATLANGSEVLFRSADNPDHLRGPNISWWWGDEAAYYHKDVWRVMIGRLRQFGKFGYAWLTTTPKGRNFLYQEFVQKTRPEYVMYNVKTWENPFLEPEIYLALADSYAGDFARQELDGDFVAFEGLIYSLFDRDVHVVTSISQIPKKFSYIVAGVDWGFVNPGVILIAGVDADGRIWIIHEEYQRRRQIDDWAEIAAQLNKQYDIRTWYCDPSEPKYIDKFKAKGCKAEGADNDVLPGIQSVQGLLPRQADLLPRLMVASSAANTVVEFEQYQWMENKLGLREEPLKSNDHTMDTLRYICHAVHGGSRRRPLSAKAREY